MARCVNALKEWTGKTRATIIYDSTVDEFTKDGLFEKVKGKPNIAVVGFTTDGDVFGWFFSVAANYLNQIIYDLNMFLFMFESRGRCATPQRFVVKEEWKEHAYVRFRKNDFNGFVDFGVSGRGGFFLGNERSNTFCSDLSRGFEGLENTTLTGQSHTNYLSPPYYHCTRLIAVQLE